MSPIFWSASAVFGQFSLQDVQLVLRILQFLVEFYDFVLIPRFADLSLQVAHLLLGIANQTDNFRKFVLVLFGPFFGVSGRLQWGDGFMIEHVVGATDIFSPHCFEGFQFGFSLLS